MHAVCAFLLLGALSAHAALLPGPERPLTAPTYGPAWGYQWVNALATDGTDFLTLWQEDTQGREGLYATVISENGAIRPLAPAPLARERGWVRAVWTGDAYLVMAGRKIMRLDRNGQSIGPPVVLPGEPSGLTQLEWNGRHALAISAREKDATAMLFDPSGRVAWEVVLPATIPPRAMYDASVAAVRDGFVLVWSEEIPPQPNAVPFAILRAARISAEGNVSAPVTVAEPFRSYIGVDTAADGDEVAVAVQAVTARNTIVRRFRIDATTLAVRNFPDVDMEYELGVPNVLRTPDGIVATYFVYVQREQATHVAVVPIDAREPRTSAAGTIPGSEVLMETNGRTVMAVAGGASGVAFDAALTRRTTGVFPVATAPMRQSTPAIGTSPGSVLMAWVDQGNDPSTGNLMVRRFDLQGNALDPQPIVLGTGASVHWTPSIVFTGRVWLVAWYSGNSQMDIRVRVQRLSPAGVPLDPQPQEIAHGQQPALAWNGSVAVLAFSPGYLKGAAVVRLSPDGERIDATPIVLADPRGWHPAIATNGREFLVTWTAEGNSTRAEGVYAVRLDAGGAPMDATPIAVARRGWPLTRGFAQVASDGTDFLVAYVSYSDERHAEVRVPAAVHAKRVLRNGALADATADQDGPLVGHGIQPALAAIGKQYLVSFLRQRSDEVLSLWAAPLDARGALLAAPREVAYGQSDSLRYALAAIGNSARVAYVRRDDDLGGVQRVFTRPLIERAAVPRQRAVRR